MEILEKANQLKKFYEEVLNFITADEKLYPETKANDESFLFLEIYQELNISEKEGLRTVLILMSKITENHRRSHNFFKKIENILSHFLTQIKQTFTNSEIFEIFKHNKRILLFLFEQKIINPDKSILTFIRNKSNSNKTKENEKGYQYDIYFYPEIKNIIIDEKKRELIESILGDYIKSEQDNFYKKRRIGENDTYICELIRQDSIEEFIAFVNKYNISLSSKIKPSIFETNSFLIQKEPSLIEYTSFFGSIKIFQYLNLNHVPITSSLWLYAIHSNNSEIIDFLVVNKIPPPDQYYEQCINESIKCHHNDIAHYIIDNLIDENDELLNIRRYFYNNRYFYAYKYYNFDFLIDFLNDKSSFYYLCQFGYYDLVNLSIKYGKIDLNESFVFKNKHLILYSSSFIYSNYLKIKKNIYLIQFLI